MVSIGITSLIVIVAAVAVITALLVLWFVRSRPVPVTAPREGSALPAGQLQTVLSHVTDGVMVTDGQAIIQMFNPAAETMFGWRESDVLGKNASILLNELLVEDDQGLVLGTRCAIGTRKNGGTFDVDITLSRLGHGPGPSANYLAILHDATERRQAEQRLIYLAQYDALTGLPTRMLFQDRATQALARADREEKLVAIMYLDLDNFKAVNDGLGHHAGDELLKAVANRITSCLRSVDTVSRMGGDEFTVIVESIPHIDNATIVAEKILDVMRDPFVVDGHELHTTLSIGITLYPMDEKDLPSLVKDADQAMYRAKQAGKNNYQLYGADMAEGLAAVKQMEAQIENALERKELVLHYQPRVNAMNGTIVGVEALLRWVHPEMGLIPAKDFMPLLEKSKLVYTVDEWVLRSACQQSRQWQMLGLPPVRVTVNISPFRFRRKGLPDLIKKVLAESGLAPEHLELDVPPESQVGLTHEHYRVTLNQLGALGVHVALVDPAVGGSILDSFQNLPQYVMKIDRSFVRDASVDSDHAAIVQAVVNLARAMKLKVVAEGVETAEQLKILRSYGCDLVQGYLFSKPVPNEDIVHMLREGRRFV